MARDLIFITSNRGGGKTSAAATFHNKPERVFWHDNEDSANNIVEQGIEFGYYGNLGKRFEDLPKDEDLLSRIAQGQLPWVTESGRLSLVSYWESVLEDLDKHLKPGKFDVYVHDTVEPLEASMHAWVKTYQRKAGVTSMARGELWWAGVYPLYQELVNSIFTRGVQTMILTSHLKTPWEGDRPVPGKVVPSGKKILYKLSRLFLWLTPETSNASGAPAAIVVKERYGKIVRDKDNNLVVRRMLPRRIPEFTWVNFRRYLKDGTDLANPSPGESLSADESEMIDEFARSDKQMELMLKNLEIEALEKKREAAELIGAAAEVPKRKTGKHDDEIRRMLSEGVSTTEISEKLGVTIPQILAVGE